VEEKAWAGVDVGKGFHWAHVVDASGTELLSRRVDNDEADLLALIDEALSLAEDVAWAVDQPGGGAALLLALLWERGQGVSYVPGLSVDRARDGYRGESKTDRKDARVIADQARMRGDLGRLEPGDDALAELQLLLARRRDLVADRTRAVTRLRETLLALFPALERAFDFNTRGPLELVARYQSSGAIRRAGRRRIAAYLNKRGVAKADAWPRRPSRPRRARAPRCLRETSPRGSSPNCPKACWSSRNASMRSTGTSGGVSVPAPRPRSSPASPAWVRSSARSSWWPWATSVPSGVPTGSPPTPGSCRPPTTPASGWATTARDGAATRS
jgi:hypothetical protein